MGDGTQIKFWHDLWCGDLPLRQRFPDLYCLARVPEAMEADYLRFQGSNNFWYVEFSRPVQDWKLDEVNSVMEILYSCRIRPGSLDSLCWNPSRHKVFEVCSFYSALVQSPPCYFPWRSVRKSKVPSRVAFFIWTAALGMILTTDNLRKQRVIILDWCCMSKSSGESEIICLCTAQLLRSYGI